jgi:arginine decarboxylase
MTELGYKGEYRGVFPIKVNQQQQVIEEVVTHGAAWHHGLEAGSKPELIIALTYLKDPILSLSAMVTKIKSLSTWL